MLDWIKWLFKNDELPDNKISVYIHIADVWAYNKGKSVAFKERKGWFSGYKHKIVVDKKRILWLSDKGGIVRVGD